MVRIGNMTVDAARLIVEGSAERFALHGICATITQNGKGKIRWTRVGESSGSGTERHEGKWDSRTITKAWLNNNGKGNLYIFVTLDPTANKGTGMRKIRIDSLISESVGSALSI